MFIDLGKERFISQLTSTFYRKDLFEDLTNLDIPIWFFIVLMTDFKSRSS